MKSFDIMALLPFVLALAAAVAAVALFRALRRNIRRAASRVTGGLAATMLSEAARQADRAAAETPRTLSNMEAVYLPKIKARYPDLNVEDLRNRAGIVLKEYLDSVQQKTPTPGLLAAAACSLADTVGHVSGPQYINRPYMLHKALVSGFADDRIQFELAYKTDRQRKASITFCYMKEKELQDGELEKKCTNCGAVLSQEAQAAGHCLYCDQVFRVVNEYTWLAVKLIIQP